MRAIDHLIERTSALGSDASGVQAPVRPTLGQWTKTDALVALSLFLGFVVLYGLTSQSRLTIDGAGLAGKAQLGTGRDYYNVLYLPMVRAVAALHWGPTDLGEIRLASRFFAALAVGACYLVVRCFGIKREPALLATLLWAFSPGLWFYATTIETHAVHAGIVGLVLVSFLALPWSRASLALLLAAALMPALLWTQQVSILLGPGLVLLADFARRRSGRPFSTRQLFLVVGPALLAGFIVALLLANLYRFGQLTPSVEGQVSQILFDKGAKNTWWTEWLAPLGVLEGLACLGLILPSARAILGPRVRWTLLLLIGPAVLFFSWWGVFERGGYFLGSAPFHVVLVGAALQDIGRGRRLFLLAGALLLLQIGLGWNALATYDVGWNPAQRAEQVRAACGEEGLLLATNNIAPPLEMQLPKLEEVLLWESCKQAMILSEGQFDPKGLLPWVLRRVARELAQGRRVAVELGYREADAVNHNRPYFPGLDAIVAALGERFVLRRIEHPDWPMAEIMERQPDQPQQSR